MPKKAIPVNPMLGDIKAGIIIGKASFKDLAALEKLEQAHRDDYHLFFLVEKGTVSIEIDFQTHKIKPLSAIYIHPNQVHRMVAFDNVTVSVWAINNENLKPEYINLLEDITPVKSLSLKEETFSLISDAASLCINISERNHEKLYHDLLKDSCNTLAALIASQYLGQGKSTDKFSRFEIITKAFKALLERNFTTAKKPIEYAKQLNISVAYLNECVKNTTGHSVSYHIQHRVILEAKRLLYHSDKSVKEIATDLGFDDYPYFSRLFAKVSGMTALAFRSKNHD